MRVFFRVLVSCAFVGFSGGLLQAQYIEGPVVEYPSNPIIADASFVGGEIVQPSVVYSEPVGSVSQETYSTPAPQPVTYASPTQSQPVTYASPVSYSAPVADAGGGGILDVVNQKRRRSGLSALAYDAELTRIAKNKSDIRANRRMTGHDGSSYGSARVEGVGYAYGGNLTNRFNTCYLYANGYRSAGAAISYDNSGRAYYTLLLR